MTDSQGVALIHGLDQAAQDEAVADEPPPPDLDVTELEQG